LDLQTISIVVTAAGILISAAFAVQQLRNLVRNRQAQLFMQLYDRFHDPEFWKQYGEIIHLSDWKDEKDFWDKYGPKNIHAFADWMSFGTYFSGIGVLLKRGMIDVGLVDDLIGDYVFWIWKKWKPLFQVWDQRKPMSIEWVEYLFDEITKERERKQRMGIYRKET
jgi:hypothetical protein